MATGQAGSEGPARDETGQSLAGGDPLAPADRFGPYRITGQLGHGGMGSVYEAVRDDDQFRKTVAIKVIHAGAVSPELLARFRQERQILADLEHPNIARLLDGGVSANGLPYLVMEKVEGQPLVRYAEASGLTVRQRLELFRQAANAVQYAHQKLIVHRDIKPGNILVTADGAAKLLDFGIAKLVDSRQPEAEALTVTGFQPMTPDYASPEQVRGEAINVASDVYSLGAVLYELLTGVKPHRLTHYGAASILEAVCQTAVTPPSACGHPALRGDLDTIILRAMQKQPERRYPSVEQFNEDIRRYLEGLPVLARPDTAFYRIGKFTRRHRAGVAAAVAVTAALTAGIAISLHQARLARERFELVRTLANTFLFDFHREIATIPGSTKAQTMVVNTATEYLDKLTRTAGSDETILADLAEAYRKLAAVQGSSSTSNSARFDQAMASLERSVQLYRRLVAVDSAQKLGLAKSLLEQASLANRLGRIPESAARAREAISIVDPLAASETAETKMLEEGSKAHHYYSRALRGSGQTAEALTEVRRSLAYLLRVEKRAPDALLSYRVAITRSTESDILIDAGDLAGAIEALEDAVSRARQLSAAEPRNRLYQRNLYLQRLNLASAWYAFDSISAEDPRKAAALLEQGWPAVSAMVDADRADRSARYDLATYASEFISPMTEIDARRAVQLGRTALATFDEALRETPGEAFLLPRRARANIRLGRALLKSGDARAAIAAAQDASDVLGSLSAKDPVSHYLRASKLLAATTLAMALDAAGREAAARIRFQEAGDLAGAIVSAKDVTVQGTYVASEAYGRFGEYWLRRGDRDQARYWFSRRVRVWADRPEKTPAIEGFRKQAEAAVRGL